MATIYRRVRYFLESLAIATLMLPAMAIINTYERLTGRIWPQEGDSRSNMTKRGGK